MADPRLILARATQGLDTFRLVDAAMMSEQFADLLESIARHYRLNPSTPLPQTLEVAIRQDGLDSQLWVRCLAAIEEGQGDNHS